MVEYDAWGHFVDVKVGRDYYRGPLSQSLVDQKLHYEQGSFYFQIIYNSVGIKEKRNRCRYFSFLGFSTADVIFYSIYKTLYKVIS